MSTETVLQGLVVVMNMVFIFLGAFVTYISYLGIKGKLKPNTVIGVGKYIIFSRNYKQYQQDEYWYPLNRYGGERTIYIGIIWTLLSLAIAILPIDPGMKMSLLSVLIIIVIISLAIIIWQVYRYVDRLVSAYQKN